MLDLCNKHVAVDEIKSACKKLGENEVGFGGTFQVGFPGETRDDIIETIDLIEYIMKVAPGATFEMYDYVPHPGTSLFELAVKKGFPNPTSFGGWTTVDYTNKPWVTKDHRDLLDRVKGGINWIGRPKGKDFDTLQRLARYNLNNIKRMVV
jgi:radical SAM superfamily enzyme YgiQ (UPF0313 family)